MSHLLPNVPAAVSDEEEENELITAPPPPLQEDAMGFKRQPPQRMIPESEVFQDKAPVVHPQPTSRVKRKVSQKQLEHLAKCREIAAQKRATRKSQQPQPQAQPQPQPQPQQQQQQQPQVDLDSFADLVIDRYEQRRQVRDAPRVRRTRQQQPPPQTQEDKDYEFWKQYF